MERLAPHVSALVIVDVLRFTSAVETACAAGVIVYPYRWRDESAAAFAASVDAVLAGRHEDAGPSLSPRSLQGLPRGSKVVLPSPNGATCSLLADGHGARVAAGCLRNAGALGRWLAEQDGPVGVVACGEVWRVDGGIRPSLEDMLGAGAVLAAVGGALSPEAESAVAAFERARPRLLEVLHSCASGRELAGYGLAADVGWCAALDAGTAVPVLRDGAFRPA